VSTGTGPKDQPHILVDARFGESVNGGSRYRYELATNLPDVCEARCTYLANRAGAVRLLRALGGGASVVTTSAEPSAHPAGDIFEHVQLPRIARRIGADIYHGTFHILPLMPPALQSVLTIHDMAVFAYPSGYGKRFVRYMKLLLPMYIQRASVIIAASNATKLEIIRYLPWAEAKIVTILHGVSSEFIGSHTLDSETIQRVQQKLSLPRHYVLFVGNLEPKKNLPRLLEGFKRFKSASGLPHKLVITGKQIASGPGSGITMSHDELHSLAHFTGYVDDADLPALYRGAEAVAYPSLYEGFGIPVLEAFAAGVPVLTSNKSSLPEVAGGAAITVDPYNPEAIALGLAQLLTDVPWRSAAIFKGLERASQLTWQMTARETAKVYYKLWERNRARNARGV
jgi:glycosyltransferase involved in cell wall biosynthesis